MTKNLSKKTIIAIAAAALILIGAVAAFFIFRNKNKITATTMRLMEMQGTVTLESGGKIKEIIDNLKLNSGDILSTASESFVSISLDDYKMVKIQENSRAEFIQSGKELALNLVEGALFFDVSKKLEEDESFQISTSTMVVGIRGTSGYVFVEEDGADGILITDGVVEITGINPLTGETKKTTGHAGQIVHVYITDDDGNSVQFDLEDAKEEDLPPMVVEFLVEHPELMKRVCEATNWDEKKIKAIYETLTAPKEQEEEQEEKKEEEKEPETVKEEEPPVQQDPPKQNDPPVQNDPPANTDDTVTDPVITDPPAEETKEETNNDDDDDDDDGDDDSPVSVSGLEMAAEASVEVGETTSLSCSVFPSNATNKTLSWSSSNTSIATVNSSGVVTGVATGTATITATATDGSGKSASCDVTVSSSVVYTNMHVCVGFVYIPSPGQTAQINYSVGPDNATDKSVTWVSDNESVATVSSTGFVTAHATGLANLEGTVNGAAPESPECFYPKVYVGSGFSLGLASTSASFDVEVHSATTTATLTGPSDFGWYAYTEYSISAPSGFSVDSTGGTFDDNGHVNFTVTQTDLTLASGTYSVTVSASSNGYTMDTKTFTITIS